MDERNPNAKRILISHDCLECIHCRKGKVVKNGDIFVQCRLQEQAYVIDNTVGVCPHHRFKLFEMKDKESSP